MSDHILTYEVEKITYEEVEKWMSSQDVHIENIIVDTGQDAADIWVDNFTQPGNFDGVDILWVIDPSGSMAADRPQVIAGIGDMMAVLTGAGWRLAIIPADPAMASVVQEFPLVPGDTAVDAENQMNTTVSGYREQGFDAVKAYMSDNSYSQTWMREDAALLIVFVSDEEEQSNANFPDHMDFVNWIANKREYVFMSSIVNFSQSTSECNAPPQFEGKRYIQATNEFFGQKIDICAEDWSQGVADAGNQITQYDYWELTHVPIYDDRIYVFIDGVPNYDWYYEPTENRVYFNTMPEEKSLVEVAYYYQ